MKKTTTPNPKLSVKVSPVESSFEVSVPGSDKIFGLEDYFKFSVAYDGTVTINDNEFSSKKQAAQALEAMAAFLRK
jgi:hypothetical protein